MDDRGADDYDPHPDLLAVVAALGGARRRQRASQTDAAHAAGLSQPTISRIESGDSAMFDSVARYARAVGLRIVAVPVEDDEP